MADEKEATVPYVVEGNEGDAYVGVSPEYATYANEGERPYATEAEKGLENYEIEAEAVEEVDSRSEYQKALDEESDDGSDAEATPAPAAAKKTAASSSTSSTSSSGA